MKKNLGLVKSDVYVPMIMKRFKEAELIINS
jgi:hypothetical protein